MNEAKITIHIEMHLEIPISKVYPIIGSKYSGPNYYVNTQTGEFWQVMPQIDRKLQAALVAPHS